MEKLLDQINSWLKHAESKNGVLIAFLGILLPFLVEKIELSKSLSIIDYWLLLFTFSNLIALILAITSFLPTLVAPKHKKGKAPTKINPYFFGHIRFLSPYKLVELISDSKEIDDKELFIADQIIINSIITFRKYKIFETSLWIIFFGFAPPIATIAFITHRLRGKV